MCLTIDSSMALDDVYVCVCVCDGEIDLNAYQVVIVYFFHLKFVEN